MSQENPGPNFNLPEIVLPEQLRQSRDIGTINSRELPWLSAENPRDLHVAELVFADDSLIYAVSAGTGAMNKISEDVAESSKTETEDPRYSRLDEFFLMASHLEASGQASASPLIKMVKGASNERFSSVNLKVFREAPKPNTRRMYFGLTRLSSYSLTKRQDLRSPIQPDANILIRLGYTDKKHQIRFLKMITKLKHGALRAGNAGSI